MSSTLDKLALYLATCCRFWIGLYLLATALLSIKYLMFHVAIVGLLLCVLSYFRLPAPEASEVHRLLGRDPLNYDGSPSRDTCRGVLGLIAHRAAPLDAPENSLEAVKKAKKAGAKSIHVNLSFTSDGIAICCRPHNLQELGCAKGHNLADMTFEDCKSSLDLAALHPLKDEYSPCRPVKAEDLVTLCLEEDLKLFLEVSCPTANLSLELVSDYVVTELFGKKSGLHSKAIVISSWPQVIFALRQKDPRIICGLHWSPDLLEKTFPKSYSIALNHVAKIGDLLLTWAVHDFLWYFLGLSIMVVDKKQITAPYVQKWRSKGIRVISSPVNKSLERLYFEKHLKITCMADTMDEIGVNKLLEEAKSF